MFNEHQKGIRQHQKFARMPYKIAKVGSKFCQMLNKPKKNCQTLLNFCKSDKISHNLVTLHSLLDTVSNISCGSNRLKNVKNRSGTISRIGIDVKIWKMVVAENDTNFFLTPSIHTL